MDSILKHINDLDAYCLKIENKRERDGHHAGTMIKSTSIIIIMLIMIVKKCSVYKGNRLHKLSKLTYSWTSSQGLPL